MNIATYIDHTLLKSSATPTDITLLCQEAITYNFFSVCVNSYYVPLVRDLLRGSDVKVCTTIGFPLGAMATETKVFETQTAIAQGAQEIDMVLNVGMLRAGAYDFVYNDIRAVKACMGDVTLKVILEISELTAAEIKTASELCIKAQADFIKTSTGFSGSGATIEAVTLMKATANGKALVKASGGIRDLETALAYIEAGADRIGTSSGVAIVQAYTQTV
ncbi:deoxyribose-phosphate aldolase [Formosa algae]|uniref:Deoxyribose-phosphate aldolase n=1 Tax=Formosa algae TaxID=225843 RepID=A0A9X0YL09_9FLAO|nr:deoxyribose-phosphate aldolase [Formosa algae]MBP1838838.1 deoxyribose-phosphate aldolase [Formosa algae]MDQ0333615.1 deoxyribose-phosphate aldolase [Formosa algae]OEI80250.1 deoxyribose-phosphate aldolase [Formosa algae]PNW27126.1 deoxyribose-phosphate aldolase [Formosa algae]